MTHLTRIIFCAPTRIRIDMYKRMTQVEMDTFHFVLRASIDAGIPRIVFPETGQLKNGGAFDFTIRATTDHDGSIRVDIDEAFVYEDIGEWRIL